MPANLKELFVDELRDIYYAEKQLVKTLPKLAKAATSPDLRAAFESHLEETEEHVSRLEQAFDLLDETPRAKTCHGILGIIEEGSELIKEKGREKGSTLDAGLIAGGQRAEHYEMAAYGSLRAWAEALGHNDIAELLSTTLDEEKAADEKLSQLAEAGINEAATAGAEESDEDEADETEETGSRRRSSGNGKATNNGKTSNGRDRQTRMNMSGNGRSAQAPRKSASRR